MIYKFIDTNGSEISVNSLSSLQALVDSETVKENTKVKAGLRGKWTTASNIQELIFTQEVIEEIQETSAPVGDIKSFIIEEEKNEEVVFETKPEEVSTQPWQTKKVDILVNKINKEPEVTKEEEIEKVEVEEKSNYELEEEKKENKRDKSYDDDENIEGLTIKAAIKIGFNKIFNFSGRASRSEYWWFYLASLVFVVVLPIVLIMAFNPNISESSLDDLTNIGYLTGLLTLSVSVRRLHDRDMSGWAILLFLIPLVNIYILVQLCSRGTSGKNQYGEYPLKLKHK
tara:strand:+ start:119 stop:973 length:855 start_codon:yes stop_codon:yes gene_type:complete